MQFAIIGAAGFIARRHFKAIYELGHEVVLAYDPASNVGFMDEYSPKIFFTQDETLFWAGATTIRPTIVICSPNYMHAKQILRAHREGLRVICEKPLCISEMELHELKTSRAQVHPIMQLRYSNAEKELAEVASRPERKSIFLRYTAPRGRWFANTWKGQDYLSGGLALNIGIHALDMIARYFGQPTGGYLRKDGMYDVRLGEHQLFVLLSTEGPPCREIDIAGEHFHTKLVFTNQMDLHREAYQAIIDGTGLSLADAVPGLKFAWNLQRLERI